MRMTSNQATLVMCACLFLVIGGLLYLMAGPLPKWWVDYRHTACVEKNGEFNVQRNIKTGTVYHSYCYKPKILKWEVY